MPNSFVHFFFSAEETLRSKEHRQVYSVCQTRLSTVSGSQWSLTRNTTTPPCVSTCKTAKIHATATPTHAIPHCLVPERASLRLGMEWHKCNSTAGNWFCSRKQGEFHDCKQTSRHSQFITNTSRNNWGMSTGHLRWIWGKIISIVTADNILSVCLIDSVCSVIGYWQLRWRTDMTQ